MQGFACIWAFRLRSTLVPLSEFERNINRSFEDFAAAHLKTPTANENKWNRIQEQVCQHLSLIIRPPTEQINILLSEQLQCCGVDGIPDYRLIAAAIPYSCCAASTDPMKHDCANMHQRGCFGVIVDTVKRMLIYAALTAFLAATVQVSVSRCFLALRMNFS